MTYLRRTFECFHRYNLYYRITHYNICIHRRLKYLFNYKKNKNSSNVEEDAREEIRNVRETQYFEIKIILVHRYYYHLNIYRFIPENIRIFHNKNVLQTD